VNDRRAHTSQPQIGDVVGHFRIVRLLGKGGMGVVFEAKDLGLGRRVALKLLRLDVRSLNDEAQARARFLREARMASRLEHPHVARVYAAGEADGRIFIAMEYVDGESLQDHLKRGVLSFQRAVDVGQQLALALEAVHALGLIHRDIKPANVMVEPNGNVKLLDFGLAKLDDESRRPDILGSLQGGAGEFETLEGQVVGTPGFMAPEQLQGGTLDPRTDLFALGAVLYVATTGKEPFPGENAVQRLIQTLTGELVSLRTHRTSLPVAFASLVHGCLQKQVDARPSSARAVHDALAAMRGFSDIDVADEFAEPTITETDSSSVRTPVVVSARSTESDVDVAAQAIRAPAVGDTPPLQSIETPARTTWTKTAALSAVLAFTFVVAVALRGLAPSSLAPLSPLRIASVSAEPEFSLYAKIGRSRENLVTALVVDPLLPIFDGRQTPETMRERGLFQSTERLEGGRVFRMVVKTDVWFHPHRCLDGEARTQGRPLVADDVVASIDQYMKHASLKPPIVGRDAFLEGATATLAGVRLVDAQTVDVEFMAASPFPDWLIGGALVIPRELFGCEDLERMTQISGTGPFAMQEPVTRPDITLRAAPRWRGMGRRKTPASSQVVVSHVPDVARAMNDLIEDRLDMFMAGSRSLDEIAAPDEKGRLQLLPAYKDKGVRLAQESDALRVGAMFLLLGLRDESPLEDERYRRAVASLVDGAEVARATGQLVGARLLPDEVLGATAPPREKLDGAAARALLDEVRRDHGGVLPLLRIAGSPTALPIVERDLRAHDIPVERSDAPPSLRDGTSDVHVMGWMMPAVDENDPALFLSSLVSAYGDLVRAPPPPSRAQVLTLADALLLETDMSNRARLYAATDTWLTSTNRIVPIAWLDRHRRTTVWLVREDVDGLVDDATGLIFDISFARLSRRR
jgi:serine/threonine protein kinase/ABC-type transport system substrate-binding protein